MQIKRFFIENLNLELEKTYDLTKDDYNYIVNVMRLKVGDELLIANNTGYDFLCEIKQITKNTVTIEVKEQKENNNESKTKVTLCQALVKGDKFELITQKIVELGLSALIPFTSTFTVVKDNTQKIDRLLKIATQASSQCGRSKTLNISEITTLKNLPNALKEYDLVLLAYEKGGLSLKNTLKECGSAKTIAYIVGSEGGFSEAEVDYLKNALNNLKVVSLGSRILRAETASVTMASAIMYELGELS